MSQVPPSDAPFEKKTIPLTDAEVRHLRNQYKILLVLPALFIGLFCITWYYNPPASVKDWIYVAAMVVGIAVATYFIVKRTRKQGGHKVIIRGVILDKTKHGKGSNASYFLKVGDEKIKVIETDFNTYEAGDLVSMEIIDDPAFWRPKITLLGKGKSTG